MRSLIDLLAQDLDAAIVILNDRISEAEDQLQQQIGEQGDILAAHGQLISEIASGIAILAARVSANEDDIVALEAVD